MNALLDQPAQPRDRDEPISIGDLVVTITRDEYIANAERLSSEAPGAYYPLGVCRHCNESLGVTEDDKVIPFPPFGFLPNVCCHACSEKGKLKIAEEDAKARAARFGAYVPAEFVFWHPAKGNNEALAAARGKFNPDSRRGLILFGQSGTGKTRIMWELVKAIADQVEPPTWAWLDSYDAATSGIPQEAARAEHLFLDDLGNEPTSTKFETALLRLIRKRCDWHKPIYISTQLTGEQFMRRFFQGAAAVAILRRLTERTDKVATG